METLDKIRTGLMNGSIKLAKVVAKPFYQKEYWPYYHEDLHHFPPQSVGYEMVRYLDSKGFKLVENYELHDVKHILTGYEMNTLGEIRLQCYLYGNGNHSLPATLSLGFGLCIIPEHVITFYRDLKRGMKARSLSNLDYAALALENLEEARKALNIREQAQEPENIFQWTMNLFKKVILSTFITISYSK